MASAEIPPKVTFEADTDQSLAWAREKRANLTGPLGDFIRHMAEVTATQIRAEFPDANVGRIVTAVADCLNALDDEMAEKHGGSDFDVLICIASLAGEQLDREAQEKSTDDA